MSDDARAYALRLLAQRAYSTRDLTRKLVRKEFEPEAIEQTIARLIEAGLLDDRKFAANYARAKLQGSASTRRITQMLQRKGIAQSIAQSAIDRAIDEEGIDTSAALEKVARRKFDSYGNLDRRVITRRLYEFLARRGYDFGEIRQVVTKLTDLLR